MQSHEDSEMQQQIEYKKLLESMTVPVPSDAEDAAKECPICKEKFKGEFSEEDEEWVWLNALESDNEIYHATCFNDSKANASVLGKRERDIDSLIKDEDDKDNVKRVAIEI